MIKSRIKIKPSFLAFSSGDNYITPFLKTQPLLMGKRGIARKILQKFLVHFSIFFEILQADYENTQRVNSALTPSVTKILSFKTPK